MRRNQGGYTLTELVVVLGLFAVVITLTTVTFSRIVSSSSHLMKSAQTQIEGMIGLELLRVDLENAGFGLPWSYQSRGWGGYGEAQSGTIAAEFNEGISSRTGQLQAPRGVLVGPGRGPNGSDYLVLKGSAVGMSRTARRWSYLTYSSTTAVVKRSKTESELVPGSEGDRAERVIVLRENLREGEVTRELVMEGSSFSFPLTSVPPRYRPTRPQERLVMYGVDPDTDLSRPFNRADYFISTPGDLPRRCAPGTGRLSKMVLNHGSSDFAAYPLLDCVADFQVVVGLDSDGDGKVDIHIDDLIPYEADAIRHEVREIAVYVLAQEGGRDRSFSYPVRDPDRAIVVGRELGRAWKAQELAERFGRNWRQYRWKEFSIVVQPKNLQ